MTSDAHLPPFHRWDLEKLVVENPSRIRGTRWRIEDVRTDYIIEAWQKENGWTWRHEWDEEEFNEDYRGGDGFKPADAVYAAMWIFFLDNQSVIFDLWVESLNNQASNPVAP